MDQSAQILDRLGRLHTTEIELGFGRIRRLLTDLGDPQDHLPPVIHIAGTNGKGSVVAALGAIARAAGLRAHAYTSPHLVRFHERIALAGQPIAEADLVRLLLRIEAVNAGRPITFFEITTAAAFLAFAEAPGDLVILETGLGGRLDATNLVARPAAVGITRIAFDHMEFLGDTLALIAAEKAAILKPGCPAATADQHPAAGDVIRAAALAVGAPLVEGGRDWQAAIRGGDLPGAGRLAVEGGPAAGLVIEGGPAAGEWPAPALAGDHQAGNMALALALARIAGGAVPALAPMADEAAMAEGLRRVVHPGRLQPVTDDLHRALPTLDPARRHRIWVDGAHNPDAMQALARQIAGPWSDAPVLMVLGLLARKDADAVLDSLAPLGGAIRLRMVPVPGGPGHDPEHLAAAARARGLDAAAAADWRQAVGDAAGDPPSRILICGSLYLAGAVLAAVDGPRPAAISAA
ncbi:cyanophycin synthetase [Tistrella sp. BH-R2-4]|uniref:Dihydrofolate synthase/folylpolyglutamate synthase n=1 Tax=Tistrella arctica TaxID=3133430 RepID=A0ABU9YH69_9PROT